MVPSESSSVTVLVMENSIADDILSLEEYNMPFQHIITGVKTLFPEGPSGIKDGSITEGQFFAEHGYWPDDPTCGSGMPFPSTEETEEPSSTLPPTA